jgi:peptide/nickel transport system substrate-binding protein
VPAAGETFTWSSRGEPRTLDPPERQAMVDGVHAIPEEWVAYVPVHVQPLVWGVREPFEAVQRPDNFIILRWITRA